MHIPLVHSDKLWLCIELLCVQYYKTSVNLGVSYVKNTYVKSAYVKSTYAKNVCTNSYISDNRETKTKEHLK